MSRNVISANPEHNILKIFRGSIPPDHLRGPKKSFLAILWLKTFFQDRLPPPKLLGGSGNMLSRKIFKIKGQRLAKNGFPEISAWKN